MSVPMARQSSILEKRREPGVSRAPLRTWTGSLLLPYMLKSAKTWTKTHHPLSPPGRSTINWGTSLFLTFCTLKYIWASLSKCLPSALHNPLYWSSVDLNTKACICHCFPSRVFLYLFSHQACDWGSRDRKLLYTSYSSKPFLRFSDSCTPKVQTLSREQLCWAKFFSRSISAQERPRANIRHKLCAGRAHCRAPWK